VSAGADGIYGGAGGQGAFGRRIRADVHDAAGGAVDYARGSAAADRGGLYCNVAGVVSYDIDLHGDRFQDGHDDACLSGVRTGVRLYSDQYAFLYRGAEEQE